VLDVVAQVLLEVRVIVEEGAKVVLRGVPEREAGRLLQGRVNVFDPLPPELRVRPEDLLLRRREHAIETPEHRQWQDDVLVLAALERVPNEAATLQMKLTTSECVIVVRPYS